jgi:hypothetical protein
MSQFDDFERQINARNEKINRSALIAVSTGVIVGTPVDKALAVGSWFFGIGSEPNKLGEEGRDSIGPMKQVVGDMKMGQVGFFVNYQPYIMKLEFDGHSNKAPNGMLRLRVVNWQKYVNNAARAIK